VTEYRVYSSTTGILPFALHAAVPVTRYLNLSLTNGTTYSYYVTAFDGSQESGSSNIVSAQPYDITPYTTTTNVTCTGVPDCGNAQGPPNESAANIPELTGELVFDFGVGHGIMDGSGPDFIFYEWPVDGVWPSAAGILLDFVKIELSADGTNWYTVFNWDGIAGGVAGTNIDVPYAADGEQDNEAIPPGALYSTTGITIDIGPWTPAGYSFHLVRFTCPAGGDGDPAQVDAVQRLN
jgi:hypothetical protein